MISSIFRHRTKTSNQAALILAVSALLSRFLGVVRDWLLAGKFGAGTDLDVYFSAFKIPDFVYNTLVAGGISIAFLPLFSEYFLKDKKEAWDFSANVLNVFLAALAVLSLLLFIFSPFLVDLISPGFDPAQKELTSNLVRIMLLSPILLGLSAIFSGILHYFDHFLAYSLCPLLYNLGIIFGIVFFSGRLGIAGVALGVILGAFLHFVFQLPSALSAGFSFKRIFRPLDEKIKRVFVLMIPRTFGITSQQINLVFINAIASTLAAGSISVFNFANNVQGLPAGVIGVSFAIAAFPALSKLWAEKNKEDFAKKFSAVFRKTFYLSLASTILIILLRNPIVDLIFRHGQFSQDAASLTSASLALFAMSIVFSSLIPLLFRAFFSFHDTKTPTVISVLSVTLNVILCFYFVKILSPGVSPAESALKSAFGIEGALNASVLGLPLALGFSTLLQFILMVVFLRKRLTREQNALS